MKNTPNSPSQSSFIRESYRDGGNRQLANSLSQASNDLNNALLSYLKCNYDISPEGFREHKLKQVFDLLSIFPEKRIGIECIAIYFCDSFILSDSIPKIANFDRYEVYSDDVGNILNNFELFVKRLNAKTIGKPTKYYEKILIEKLKNLLKKTINNFLTNLKDNPDEQLPELLFYALKSQNYGTVKIATEELIKEYLDQNIDFYKGNLRLTNQLFQMLEGEVYNEYKEKIFLKFCDVANAKVKSYLMINKYPITLFDPEFIKTKIYNAIFEGQIDELFNVNNSVNEQVLIKFLKEKDKILSPSKVSFVDPKLEYKIKKLEEGIHHLSTRHEQKDPSKIEHSSLDQVQEIDNFTSQASISKNQFELTDSSSSELDTKIRLFLKQKPEQIDFLQDKSLIANPQKIYHELQAFREKLFDDKYKISLKDLEIIRDYLSFIDDKFNESLYRFESQAKSSQDDLQLSSIEPSYNLTHSYLNRSADERLCFDTKSSRARLSFLKRSDFDERIKDLRKLIKSKLIKELRKILKSTTHEIDFLSSHSPIKMVKSTLPSPHALRVRSPGVDVLSGRSSGVDFLRERLGPEVLTRPRS